MTHEELLRYAEEHYGMAGVYAVESMCLTEADRAEGYEHCMDKIAPALEEELRADGGL